MLRLVGIQLILLALILPLAYAVVGQNATLSMAIGGLSYIVPTFIAVLFLRFLKTYPTLVGKGFIVTEILKIILSLILMLIIFLTYQDLAFLPYFIGLLTVSHFAFLLFLRVHRYGK